MKVSTRARGDVRRGVRAVLCGLLACTALAAVVLVASPAQADPSSDLRDLKAHAMLEQARTRLLLGDHDGAAKLAYQAAQLLTFSDRNGDRNGHLPRVTTMRRELETRK